MRTRVLALCLAVVAVSAGFHVSRAYAADGLLGLFSKKINLSVDKYVPNLDASLISKYRGTHLSIKHFTNEAEDTGLWSYSSQDGKFSYKTSHNLNTFLWLCMEKAALSLEMMAYRETPASSDVPELDIIFSSWSQERFVGRLSLVKSGRMVYQKNLEILFPAVESIQPLALEKRAYACLDAIVTGMLGNPDFQAAFFTRVP